MTTWPARVELRSDVVLLPESFSPDGTKLVTRHNSGKGLDLWDLASRKILSSWIDEDGRDRFGGEFSPDGHTLASPWHLPKSGMNFSVDLIDLTSGKVRFTFDSPLGGCFGVRFREEGRVVRLVSSGNGPSAGHQILDVEVVSGRILSDRSFAVGVPTAFLSFSALSEDGRLRAMSDPGTLGRPGGLAAITIWDLDEDREVGRLQPGNASGSAACASFSTDNKLMALGYMDGRIEVWDIPGRRLRCSNRGHHPDYRAVCLTFSPDGSVLASTGYFVGNAKISIGMARQLYAHYFRDKYHQNLDELLLIDTIDGQTLRRSQDACLAVFSPDGKILATAHDDDSVQIHDVPKRR